VPGYACRGLPPQGRGSMTTATFTGMPDEGLAFLEDLEERNTKAFFDANKALFTTQVQAPFAVLVEAAAARLRRSVPGIGRPKLLPIYRDLPFSNDKTPYKTSMSASVPSRAPGDGDGPGVPTGFYVNVGPAGLYVASGLYHPARDELERVRGAIADPATGPEPAANLAQEGRPAPRPLARPPPAHAQGVAARPPSGRPPQGPLPGPQPPARARPLAQHGRAARPPAGRLEGHDPLQPLAGAGPLGQPGADEHHQHGRVGAEVLEGVLGPGRDQTALALGRPLPRGPPPASPPARRVPAMRLLTYRPAAPCTDGGPELDEGHPRQGRRGHRQGRRARR